MGDTPESSGSSEATFIPEGYSDLLDRPISASMTTVLPDDTLHGTVVWIDYQANKILVNTAEGRRKVKNVRLDPRVSFLVVDPDSDYRYLWINGRVSEITSDGASAHADTLAQQYLDVETYPYHESDTQRLILYIDPDHCRGFTNPDLV